MSFVQTPAISGKAYAPGWFLADAENCERRTKTIAASGAADGENGGKYVPMGTIYPTNDSSAIGIVYEDVDVTAGDMPGSVVLSGTVYEDRLAVSSYSYDSVTVGNYVSPKDMGWYERSGSADPGYTYTLSTDTTASALKTYYAKDGESYDAVTIGDFVNPKAHGWYESDGGSGYEASDDTEADGSKTYYEQSAVRMSANAKSALAAKGFRFITSVPAISRPY